MFAAAAQPTKAEKFHHLQIRSVLDDPMTGDGAGADETWARLLANPSMRSHAETPVALALPTTQAAEESLLGAVERLADALTRQEALADFYKHFGWGSADEYFQAMGERQIMLVDVDHNDSDDRLAIVILAYQMASASAERRLRSPSSTCALYLDGRTYEHSPLTVWRTLRLASRLHRDLFERYGVAVEPVFSDPAEILKLVASHLGVPPEPKALDQIAPGVAATTALRSQAAAAAPPGGIRRRLCEGWPDGSRVSLWLLSGLCMLQVKDILQACNASGMHFVVFEQAQPAWQSMDVPADAILQPEWDFPPPDAAAVERGYGAEPSNVRSGEAPYPEILDTYMLLQQAVASTPEKFTYVCPALARSEGFLPVPPGQAMRRVSGRPLAVLPGKTYAVKRALDADRTSKAFARLLDAARGGLPESLYPELCTSTQTDAGHERKELAHILKHGTFMADAILVALAARPSSELEVGVVVRRLAVVGMMTEDAVQPAMVGDTRREPVVSEASLGPPQGCLACITSAG